MINEIPEDIAFAYELVKKIGEGANGETWLIRDRVKKTQAVLKFLKFLSAEDLKTVELFQREAELLKSIHVEGVPAFYAYHTDKTGNGYLIQEFISAPSIQNLLDDGVVFDESETLIVAAKVAEIIVRLQSDYRPPIIHRDIKPSNILYDRESGRVWLIDFGSVAHPQKRSGGSTIAGTFGYMPPEQVFGNIAIQSDYYALGATMLHMLTGVFPGEMSSNMYQLRIKTILAEKAPQTSEQMTHLLRALLSAEIEKRPKTADELLKILKELQMPNKGRGLSKRLKSIWDSINQVIDNALHRYNHRLRTAENTSLIGSIHLKPSPFWHHAEGTIHSSTKIEIKPDKKKAEEEIEIKYALNYTFEARGKTWAGYMTFPAHRVKDYKFPLKCSVLYDPLFPFDNVICTIGEDAPKPLKGQIK